MDLEKRLREWEQMQSPDYLHMVGMEELMDQTFPVKEPVIDGLLYKGVYLFAGAPKIGKSFLVLQIAYAVSRHIWVTRSNGTYLALEDRTGGPGAHARCFSRRPWGSDVGGGGRARD
ncbi:MAG: AAA family ATPase [Flavonifractor plautii]